MPVETGLERGRAAAKPTGYNFYRYASNNPVNRVDPSGLENEWWYFAPAEGAPSGKVRRYMDFVAGADGGGIFPENDGKLGSGNYKPIGNAPKRLIDGKMSPTTAGWDQAYNKFIDTNKLDSDAALKGGTKAGPKNFRFPKFRLNSLLVGPLRILNLKGLWDDMVSWHDVICNDAPPKIPIRWIEGSYDFGGDSLAPGVHIVWPNIYDVRYRDSHWNS